MHSLENFIKKIFNALTEHHQIEHFEIYGEYTKNDILMSQLDSRGRWMGDISKDSNLHAKIIQIFDFRIQLGQIPEI